MRQRTRTIDALPRHVAEHGVVAPTGIAHVGRLEALIEGDEGMLPAPVVTLARMLLSQMEPQIGLNATRGRVGAYAR